MSEAAAALHGVAQRFGRKVVLRDLELELRPGSIVGLVGANGSGKTTLFAVLAGLLQPDTGERQLFGRAADEVDAGARARLAYVAHATQLYGALSARENLRLFADLRAAAGLSTRPADEVLLELGLSAEALGRPVATFSRGMAQRVALARALAARPELLLLDEPFTALDAAGRGMLSRVLLGERSRGAAVLLSSHDFDALVQICDRIVLLEGGALVRSVEHHEHQSDRDGFRRRAAALWHDLPADPGDTMADGPL